MTSKKKPKPKDTPRTITMQRVYHASVEELWDRWTTKAGIESWWGPDGFITRVRTLDVRPGGGFEYAIIAIDPDQVEALKAAHLPLSNIARCAFTAVDPMRRIAYKTSAGFVPGVAPYEVATLVEIESEEDWVKMVVTQDDIRDPELTRMAAIGLDQQFNKLGRVLLETNRKERDPK